jgi:hypothetical protein
MAAQPKDDVVYALHDFEAENEDELSFVMGEEIVVLERDDQYGDGWFSVSKTSIASRPGIQD